MNNQYYNTDIDTLTKAKALLRHDIYNNEQCTQEMLLVQSLSSKGNVAVTVLRIPVLESG